MSSSVRSAFVWLSGHAIQYLLDDNTTGSGYGWGELTYNRADFGPVSLGYNTTTELTKLHERHFSLPTGLEFSARSNGLVFSM